MSILREINRKHLYINNLKKEKAYVYVDMLGMFTLPHLPYIRTRVHDYSTGRRIERYRSVLRDDTRNPIRGHSTSFRFLSLSLLYLLREVYAPSDG